MLHWLNRAIRQRRDDEGSLVLAMFAIMVLTGLIAVTFAGVNAGQRQTVEDEKFEEALQVSEAGLNQMVSLVQSQPDAASVGTITQTMPDGGTYTVTAAKDVSTGKWTVQSTGTAPDGTVRKVQQHIETSTLFEFAAFGKSFANLNGGNGADSYDSSANSAIDGDGFPVAKTGNGKVATNGVLTLKGQVATDTDLAEIHYANGNTPIADPLPDATGESGHINTTAMASETPPRLTYHRQPIELPSIEICPGTATTSFNGIGTLGPSNGTPLYYTDIEFSEDTVFTGTVDNPTVICMTGSLTVGNGQSINFDTATGYPRPPGTLFIFGTYAGTDEGLDFGNHVNISAAIYAPNYAMSGGAQGNLYGSIICNNISTQGGWNFHYDDALQDAELNAPAVLSNWTEVKS